MPQGYLRKTDIKRICAAFEEAIAESRKPHSLSKFPCAMFRYGENHSLCYLCPIYNDLFPFGCFRARIRGETHDVWLNSYHAWLTLFSMTFKEARKKLDEWDEFLKLDKILCEVCDGWNHEN